jgi:hypothetical protein
MDTVSSLFDKATYAHGLAGALSTVALLEPEKEKAEYAYLEKAYRRIESRTGGYYLRKRRESLRQRMIRYINTYRC